MALPVVGHHDARQAGVAGKVNAEQIEDLALVKVRRGPRRSDGINRQVGGVEPHRQPHPFLQAVRNNVVRELKTRLLRIPVPSTKWDLLSAIRGARSSSLKKIGNERM